MCDGDTHIYVAHERVCVCRVLAGVHARDQHFSRSVPLDMSLDRGSGPPRSVRQSTSSRYRRSLSAIIAQDKRCCCCCRRLIDFIDKTCALRVRRVHPAREAIYRDATHPIPNIKEAYTYHIIMVVNISASPRRPLRDLISRCSSAASANRSSG